MALSRLIGLFTLLVVAALLAPSFAQDKKDDPKDAKKDDPKKDDPKGDAKKDDEKPKKDVKPPEEKVDYGQTLTAKIKQMDSESAKDIILEIQVPDPAKILALTQWKHQQLAQIAQQTNPQQRAQQLRQYQTDLVKRQLDQTKPADYPIRAADNVKVRTNFAPIEYDDKGNLKKWTPKTLAALKGNSKLPGYPAEFDVLRPGQVVTVYLSKQSTPALKTKGKKTDDDDLGTARPEAVMIVILAEARTP